MAGEIDPQFGQILIDKFIVEGVKTIPGKISAWLSGINDALGKNARDTWKQNVDSMIAKGFIDADTGAELIKLREDTSSIGTITTLLLKLQLYMAVLKVTVDTASLDRQYDLLSRTTPHPAPVEALVKSMIIDPTRATINFAELKRHGFSDKQIENIVLSHYATVPEEIVRILYLRGEYDTAKLYERMRELGYTDTRTAEIVKSWPLLPPPQDLFTMVAHEAFEPELYKKLGLDAEFPSDQVQWLEKQGISSDWAMKYWIAHWSQPSIEQGFEMLHRGIITRAELEMLFKVQEIPGFWRDKLMQMTYQPYTRVDVRRMHELGVLDAKALVLSYQDLGYDAEKAVKMAEFTIKLNQQNDVDVTRSTILNSYADNLIDKSDAKELLMSQGLNDDTAEFYLNKVEFEQELEIAKMYINVIKERFLLSIIAENEARTELNKLNLKGKKIDALIDQWKVQRYKYEQLPSRSDLDDFLIEGIINEGQWNNIMSRHGYSAEHKSWYLEQISKYVEVSQTLPSKTDLNTWYKKGRINDKEYTDNMRLLGYSNYYINLYLTDLKDEITK